MIAGESSYTVKTKKDMRALLSDLNALAQRRVLVGVPEDENSRGENGYKDPIGNAALAYIHDNGSPAQGIPARPFMQPGIKKAKVKIYLELKLASERFLAGDETEGQKHLEQAGMLAVSAIRMIIEKGAGFSPLKRATLLGRLRKRKSLYSQLKGKKEDREEIMASFKPLIDTGEMMKSITYVVEDVGEEKK